MAGTDGKADSLGSVPNVTLVSIFVVAIFAIITQLLAASGAISLSTTLQLTMWLVALGFVVLLAIAYMFFRAFERVYPTPANAQVSAERTGLLSVSVPEDANGQRDDDPPETQAPPAPKLNDQEGGQRGPGPGSTRNPPPYGSRPVIRGWMPDGSAPKAEDTWVPPDDLRQLEGTEYSVRTEDVFPDGCYLEPDSIKLVSDKPTGQVYECRVVDRNLALEDRPHEAVVKILATQEPSLESMPRFGRVEFEQLTITPYVTDQDPMRIRYMLRATGLRRAVPPPGRELATWSVPPQGSAPPEETGAHVDTTDTPDGAADTS